jgi:Spy/CpxP family protein refolding chaperone
MRTPTTMIMNLACALSGALAVTGAASASDAPGRFAMHADAPRYGHDRHMGGRDEYADDGIDARQERQRQEIREGMRRGLLTGDEARYLWREQNAIERMEQRFESDGHLTERERARLNRELNEARWNIRQHSWDDDRRGYGYHGGYGYGHGPDIHWNPWR